VSFTVTPTITITAPTAASSWPAGSAQNVTWTLSTPVSAGEFRVWLISSGGTWYKGKQVVPVAAQTSYTTAITASVPAASGYKAAVYWRSTVGSGSWTATARSAAFTVTAAAVELWVDPARGDDAAAGTSRATALRTLSAAWERVSAGEP
jgi:hypothetical protein